VGPRERFLGGSDRDERDGPGNRAHAALERVLLSLTAVSETAKRQPTALVRIPDPGVLELNLSAALLAEELLALPSAFSASRAASLLWEGASVLPAAFLAAVGSGRPLLVGPLVRSRQPLATPIPSHLAEARAGLGGAGVARHARALARGRYRALQGALVGGDDAAPPSGALLRYTFGSDGRPWMWAEAARRILDRVSGLNRAALMAARQRARTGASGVPGGDSDDAIDSLAEALPPIAVPDFRRIAEAIAAPRPEVEDSVERHRALFAELLAMAPAQAVPA